MSIQTDIVNLFMDDFAGQVNFVLDKSRGRGDLFFLGALFVFV